MLGWVNDVISPYICIFYAIFQTSGTNADNISKW